MAEVGSPHEDTGLGMKSLALSPSITTYSYFIELATGDPRVTPTVWAIEQLLKRLQPWVPQQSPGMLAWLPILSPQLTSRKAEVDVVS